MKCFPSWLVITCVIIRAKIWNVLLDSGIFMHLEEMAAQIVDLFARLGGEGCWSTLSTPPRYGPELYAPRRSIRKLQVSALFGVFKFAERKR